MVCTINSSNKCNCATHLLWFGESIHTVLIWFDSKLMLPYPPLIIINGDKYWISQERNDTPNPDNASQLLEVIEMNGLTVAVMKLLDNEGFTCIFVTFEDSSVLNCNSTNQTIQISCWTRKLRFLIYILPSTVYREENRLLQHISSWRHFGTIYAVKLRKIRSIWTDKQHIVFNHKLLFKAILIKYVLRHLKPFKKCRGDCVYIILV
jgi:hypothetical protein